MDPLIFMRYIKFADSYRQGQQNIYFFLKDCGFKRIYRESGNRFPNQETQSMFQAFQNETKQANWTSNKMTANDYKMFLEDFFKKMNFNSIDLDTCIILKLITENLGVFGAFDNLTNKRIVYFNNKIEKLKTVQPVKTSTSGPMSYQPSPSNTSVPQNTISSAPVAVDSMGLPEVGKGGAEAKEAQKAAQSAEVERLNEIMKQQKLNSPIYITNGEPGKYYNPLTNSNYIPNGVNRNIPLPMNRKDPNFVHLKKEIDKELILANQELDYHKIDMARNHLEIAAYYIKNIID